MYTLRQRGSSPAACWTSQSELCTFDSNDEGASLTREGERAVLVLGGNREVHESSGGSACRRRACRAGLAHAPARMRPRAGTHAPTQPCGPRGRREEVAKTQRSAAIDVRLQAYHTYLQV
ncbi:unnamed protein product [Rangifer tarandus platyrhynchus]|uniref:Uncharacterized protein n=1 Tax=Rangifer tarandus platyrhynchus TaxID=3082113 RepID=A0AC60A4N0_RANTA